MHVTKFWGIDKLFRQGGGESLCLWPKFIVLTDSVHPRMNVACIKTALLHVIITSFRWFVLNRTTVSSESRLAPAHSRAIQHKLAHGAKNKSSIKTLHDGNLV